jgi:hypothetical protein
VVIARFFKIFFRRNKDIKELFLNYETEHLFDNSYLVINYRFRNALYYQFGDTKTLEKHIKIFDLKNCGKEMDFMVYGLFESKPYKLKFDPQLFLNNSSFKTSISKLNIKLEEQTIPKLVHPNINSNIKKPKIIIPNIEINHKPITISNTTFNQTDYI